MISLIQFEIFVQKPFCSYAALKVYSIGVLLHIAPSFRAFLSCLKAKSSSVQRSQPA